MTDCTGWDWLESPGAPKQSEEPLSLTCGTREQSRHSVPHSCLGKPSAAILWDLGEHWDCGHWAGKVWETECPLAAGHSVLLVPPVSALAPEGWEELDLQRSIKDSSEVAGHRAHPGLRVP